MAKENDVQKRKLLIVEGNHERDFFDAWFRRLGLTQIQILPIGGKTQLAMNLGLLVKRPNFAEVDTLVIIRDADDNPAGALQAVAAALAGAGLPAPEGVGQYVQRDGLRTAVVITPGEGRKGALEELLLETAVSDPVCPRAEAFIGEAVGLLESTPIRPAPPA